MSSGDHPPIPLRGEVAEAVTFQSYDAAPRIEGVWTRDLKKFRAENGWFAELLRLDQGQDQGENPTGDPMVLRQLSASRAEPGRINAFHLHPRSPQHELWTVLQGELLVWLVDCRADSSTSGVRQRVVLSGEAPIQLYIPAGVAHGYKAGGSGALLIYAMTEQFNRETPNEGRLPWDHFGSELWEEDRG